MAEMDQSPVAFRPEVVKRFLARLEIAVPMGVVEHALDRDSIRSADSANAGLRALFHELRMEGLRVVELRWGRFDLRRLPVLARLGEGEAEEWKLVERGEPGFVKITAADGSEVEIGEDEVDAKTTILWVRSDGKRSESEREFFSSPAATLVREELFRERGWFREVAIATLVVNILAVSTSLFAMQVYDRVVPTLAYATLWTLVAGMAIVLSLDWTLKTFRARVIDATACAVDKAVSQRVFDHVTRLRLDARPGSLGTLAAQVNGLDSVRQFFSSSIVFALIDMPFALLFLGVIALVGGHVAWVYLLLLPTAGLFGFWTQRSLRRLTRQRLARSNERQGLLVDVIRGGESVRATSSAWRFSDQWQEISREVARYQLQQRAVSQRATTTTGSLASVAYVSALCVGVWQIEAGNITMGALIACSILGGRVIGPVSQSAQYLSQWQGVSESLALVDRVLGIELERDPQKKLLVPDAPADRIEIKQVRFAYPESPTEQLDVSDLEFVAGDRVALVGAVGSGKSTLLKVLAGLYRPSAGRVRLGQADLWEIDPSIVADNISYLPQNVHLFHGSLRSNLALSGGIGDSQLLAIAEELGIDRIAADSPQHYEREISEGGDGLSGGQRQLVGLARVFLAKPKVWLLDEPTASLDTDTERKVLAAIKSHVREEDILVVATHRPGLAAQIANRIVVMQQGRVVHDGKPEDVIGQLRSPGRRKKPAFDSRAVPTAERPVGHA